MSGPPPAAVDLIGRWELVSWTGETDSGRRVHHGGKTPAGVLIYDLSGRMAVQIQHDGRRPIGSRDLAAGDEELQADAYRTYIAYAGTFSLPEPGIVVHHLTQSLHPDQVGMDKRRPYALEGDELTLSTQPIDIEGERATSELAWRRVVDPA